MDLIKSIPQYLTHPKHTRWIAPCLILGEAVLCGLIIWKVAYTEIDYTTYMEQVTIYQSGERDYSQITGPTGPLVYPALHVYIYNLLHQLTVTETTNPLNYGLKDYAIDIGRAQVIFACVYLLTLAVVIACYRRVGAPAWLLAPLVLSKRLHSIFLLRLFNDGWATFFLWLAIYALQRRRWTAGMLLWTLGVGVKMTMVLALPAVAVILVQSVGLADAVFLGFVAVVVQGAIGMPFLAHKPLAYVNSAFDLRREFLHKWTVNWRFIEEPTFLSNEFKISLLVLHATLVVTFLQAKWTRLSSSGLVKFCQRYLVGKIDATEQVKISSKVSPTFVMDTMLGAVVIGLLCARSLHYQFYAYLGWTTPYLLWRAVPKPFWVLPICVVQEVAWLTYPSSNFSSYLVVLSLALQTMSALIAPPVDHISRPAPTRPKEVAKVLHKDDAT